MRPLAVVFALVAVACGGGAADSPSSDGSADGPPLIIERVVFDTSEVVLKNVSTDPYDVTGHALCNRPNYLTLPGQVLGPGESLTVDASSLLISPGGGEVGLYVASSFGDSGAILGYVQWGSDSHGRTDVAVAGGVWNAGDFVPGGAGALVATSDSPDTADEWTTE